MAKKIAFLNFNTIAQSKISHKNKQDICLGDYIENIQFNILLKDTCCISNNCLTRVNPFSTKIFRRETFVSICKILLHKSSTEVGEK